MKFVAALNALGPIPTALLLIVMGASFMLIFKAAGLSAEDVKTGHDIVIAGISFISGIAVASRMQSSEGHAAGASQAPGAAISNPQQPGGPAQTK